YSHPSVVAGLFFPTTLFPSPRHCRRSHLLTQERYPLQLLQVQGHMPFPGLSPHQSPMRPSPVRLLHPNFSFLTSDLPEGNTLSTIKNNTSKVQRFRINCKMRQTINLNSQQV